MKKSGLIRRIDELGRIVIPKEIRKTLHIKEGTPLDIIVENGELIVLKKFSPIKEIENNAFVCAEILYDELQQPVIITDLDKTVVSVGLKINHDKLNPKIIKLFNNRKLQIIENFNDIIVENETTSHKNIIISPIIIEGDILGSIIVDYKILDNTALSNIRLCTNLISKLAY